MRTLSLLPIVLGAAALFLPACEDQSHPPDQGTAYHRANDIDPREIPPHNGMTKSEVLAQYGRPGRAFVDDSGETWSYLLNGGEIIGKSFIPFYIPPRPRYGVLTFGPNGTVVRYHWEPSRDAVASGRQQ